MEMDKPVRCAVMGQHPMRFPWGFDEEDDRCRKLKIELAQQIMMLRQNGVSQFLTACDCGVGLYAAEIVNGLRATTDHDLMLICYTPHEEQATKWAPYLRERYFNMLTACTYLSAVCEAGAPGAQLQAYKKIIDLADVVLCVYDKAIDAGLEYLSSVQLADGSFANMSKETPDGEVTLAVLKMMEALDISLEDERFVKNGNTVADAMQTFYVDGVGFISNFDVEAPLDNLEILPRYDNPNMGVSDTISALTYLQAAENGKFGPDGTGNSVFEIVGSALTETPLGAILLAVIIVALLAFGMVRRYRRIKKEQ